MHITLATVGSRGDVQPYIALGVGLKAAGHSVNVATHTYFEAVIREHGLDFSPVVGDPRKTVESELGQQWLATGSNMLGFVKRMAELMRPMMVRATSDCLNACKGADLVLYSVLGWLGAHSVVEKLGIPAYAAFLQPATPTRFFPSFAYPIRANLGGLHNRLTYYSGEQLFWLAFRGSINQARKEVLGLPPLPFLSPARKLRELDLPVFYGYSPTVLAKPPDWPSSVHVTGYWFLDQTAEWEPPADLVEFLKAGPPPVYIGFGSMHDRDAARRTNTVVETLSRAGLRGIIQTGWGALSHEDLPDHVHAVESVPHEWLFPQLAAVVHHGGAGTTAAALRAGVPSIVVPFFGDQFFWGRRVAALGTGPQPIPVKRLTTKRLANALGTATTNESMRDRASSVGARIRAEDGVARVVEVLGESPNRRGAAQKPT
jgi:sterol 3beta-glucosyltransferase